MSSARTRIMAFAPLVTLSVLTALAAAAGVRTSDSDSGSSASSRSADAFDVEAAIDRIADAGTGRYRDSIDFGPIHIEETGAFDIASQRYETTKSYPLDPRSTKRLTLRVRYLADDTAYIQRLMPGKAPSCWGLFTGDEMSQFTNEELSQPSELSPLPGPLLTLLSVEESGATRHGTEVRAQVDAYFGLVLLGVASRTMFLLSDRLEGHLVPVVLLLDRDSADAEVIGARISGTDARSALRDDHVDLGDKLDRGIGYATSTLELSHQGEPVDVVEPALSDIATGKSWYSCLSKS